MKVVNLSDFQLEERHHKLLRKGLSFSPTSRMDHFEVYKDLCLFLRRVVSPSSTRGKQAINDPIGETHPMDTVAIDHLVSLLEEAGPSSEDDEPTDITPWRRNPNPNIRSTSMPQFRKNKWLMFFWIWSRRTSTKSTGQ